jgi:tetratricopeptide (TPR) repeat protein
MRARLLLLAGALVAFGASLGSGFHFDDYAIFSNPALISPEGFVDFWSLRQTRPLTYLTFWLNYLVGGRDPLGYHLLNLALHVGAVLLAFECLRRLVPERTALFAAAVFAAHPIQAESVDYVWGRSIVLASLLTLASLCSWVKGQRWLAVAWFLAALLAKEEVAAFPLVLLLFDRQELKRNWAPIGCMLTLAFAAGARVIYATAVTPGAPAGLQAGISPWNYWLAQGLVILRYLRLLVIPYGFSIDPNVTVPTIWLGLGAWLLLLGLLIFAWQRGKGWAVWLIAGFLLLIPSSSLFPAADLSADRRMYLPLLAFAVAAGLLLERVKQPAIPIAIVAAFAIIGFTRTMVWMSDEALWREAMERAPQKVRPRIQLARALPAAAALEILAQARNLAPYDPAVAAETGKTLLAENQPEAALQEFGRALALDPKDAANLNNRGVALQAIGQTEAARADFERALTIDPTLSEARQNLQKLPAR